MTMPEMIWEYGEILPRLDSLELVSSALEKKFLVLECASCDYIIEKDFSKYQLALKDSIDLNRDALDSKNYRTRKKSRIFLVTSR